MVVASGNAKVNVGGAVLVVGGVSKSGNAAVTKTGTPASASDPLAGLPLPAVTDSSSSPLPSYGPVSVSGNTTKTLQPGIYTSIQVSGNAKVTLNSGVYIIEGGGLSVSGNASVSGKSVMIFNAGRVPTTAPPTAAPKGASRWSAPGRSPCRDRPAVRTPASSSSNQ